MIGNALEDVFRQKATIMYNDGQRFDTLIINTVKKMFYITVIPFALLFFTIEDIFSFIFGENWVVAGQYGKILLISAFFSVIITPIDKAAVVVGATGYIFK